MSFRRSGVKNTDRPSSLTHFTEDSIMNDLSLRNAILDELQFQPAIDAEGIHVKVQGDVVKLEGRVHLWRQRQIAERAAWSVPGVKEVIDHMLLA
jgi:osmotically-inducible protein OsmY